MRAGAMQELYCSRGGKKLPSTTSSAGLLLKDTGVFVIGCGIAGLHQARSIAAVEGRGGLVKTRFCGVPSLRMTAGKTGRIKRMTKKTTFRDDDPRVKVDEDWMECT